MKGWSTKGAEGVGQECHAPAWIVLSPQLGALPEGVGQECHAPAWIVLSPQLGALHRVEELTRRVFL